MLSNNVFGMSSSSIHLGSSTFSSNSISSFTSIISFRTGSNSSTNSFSTILSSKLVTITSIFTDNTESFTIS